MLHQPDEILYSRFYLCSTLCRKLRSQPLWLECIAQSTKYPKHFFPHRLTLAVSYLPVIFKFQMWSFCSSLSDISLSSLTQVWPSRNFCPSQCSLGSLFPMLYPLLFLVLHWKTHSLGHVNFHLHIWVILPMYPHCLDLISYAELGLHWNQS